MRSVRAVAVVGYRVGASRRADVSPVPSCPPRGFGGGRVSVTDSLVMEAMKDLPPELGTVFVRELSHFLDLLRATPERTATFGVVWEFDAEAAIRAATRSPTASLWVAFAESVRLADLVLEMEHSA